jgi:hypothetical protein
MSSSFDLLEGLFFSDNFANFLNDSDENPIRNELDFVVLFHLRTLTAAKL